MTHAQAERNVWLYRMYLMFNEPLLWGPILISYMIHVGKMELSDIYLMESVVVLGFLFLEVPSGALADLIGRKKTIVLGSMLHLVSITCFAFSSSPAGMWTANILWMIGFSCSSGADSAFLYDSLKKLGRENEYGQIEGRSIGTRLLVVAFCSLATGLLAETHMRIPLMISIPGVVFSTICTFRFVEPRATRLYTARDHMNLMKVSVLFVVNHRAVKWVIGFSVLLTTSSKVWFFTYNPYFELVELPIAYYGVMFFLLNLTAWFFSRYSHEIRMRMNERRVVVFMVALIGLPMLLMGTFVAFFSAGLILCQNIVRGFEKPFFGMLLNKHLDSENRATVISIKSAVLGLSQFLGLGLFGLLVGAAPLAVCLQIVGGIVLVLGTLGVIKHRKIFV